MYKLFALVVMISITGCMAPSYNYVPSVSSFSEPPLNSVNFASIGDVLLRQGKQVDGEVLSVAGQISIGSYTIPAGNYPKRGVNGNGQFFSLTSKAGQSVQTGFLADPPQTIAIKNNKQICIVTNLNTTNCRHSPSYKISKSAEQHPDAFQQTLLYNGRVGDKINIAYREFSNDRARPAFNNEVEYDLSESNEIAYKGAYLQILEASNTRIKYKVLSNFNKAQY